MTKYQWIVIKAIIRLVLKIEQRTNDDNDEWFDSEAIGDRAILEEALKRDE